MLVAPEGAVARLGRKPTGSTLEELNVRRIKLTLLVIAVAAMVAMMAMGQSPQLPQPPLGDTRLSVNTLLREDIFAGFLPVFVSSRRRALQDYLAQTDEIASEP